MEGDLRQYVKAKNPLPADTLRSMFFQILLGPRTLRDLGGNVVSELLTIGNQKFSSASLS